MESKVKQALRRAARMGLRRAICDAEYYGVSQGSAIDLVNQVYDDIGEEDWYSDSELDPNQEEEE